MRKIAQRSRGPRRVRALSFFELRPRKPSRSIEITPKTMVMALLLFAGAWVFLHLLPLVLVLVVTLLIVGTLSPIVRWLEGRGVRRGWGIALTFAVMVLLGALVAIVTVPPLISELRALINREPQIRAALADAMSRSRLTENFAESLRNVRYDALIRSSAATALAASTRAAEVVLYLLTALFLALYTMIDRDHLRGSVFALLPRRYHMRLSRVLLNLESIVGGYIRGQALTSALLAVFVFVLLTVCKVPQALAIAVFAAVADVLPYVGVVLAIAPAALAASGRGLVIVLIVVSAMVAYLEFEGRVLVPRIYGRALRLPSSIVLAALFTGAVLLGVVGAVLSLPLAATIRMMIEELRLRLPGERARDERERARDLRDEAEYLRRSRQLSAFEASAIAVEIAEQRQREEPDPEPPPTAAAAAGQRG